VILAEGIREDLFCNLDHVRAFDGIRLDMVFRYGPDYRVVNGIVDLVRIHRGFFNDSLDDVLAPKIMKSLGYRPGE